MPLVYEKQRRARTEFCGKTLIRPTVSERVYAPAYWNLLSEDAPGSVIPNTKGPLRFMFSGGIPNPMVDNQRMWVLAKLDTPLWPTSRLDLCVWLKDYAAGCAGYISFRTIQEPWNPTTVSWNSLASLGVTVAPSDNQPADGCTGAPWQTIRQWYNEIAQDYQSDDDTVSESLSAPVTQCTASPGINAFTVLQTLIRVAPSPGYGDQSKRIYGLLFALAGGYGVTNGTTSATPYIPALITGIQDCELRRSWGDPYAE